MHSMSALHASQLLNPTGDHEFHTDLFHADGYTAGLRHRNSAGRVENKSIIAGESMNAIVESEGNSCVHWQKKSLETLLFQSFQVWVRRFELPAS